MQKNRAHITIITKQNDIPMILAYSMAYEIRNNN